MGLRGSQACKLVRTTTRNVRCPERRCIFLIGVVQKFDEHNRFSLIEELVTHMFLGNTVGQRTLRIQAMEDAITAAA